MPLPRESKKEIGTFLKKGNKISAGMFPNIALMVFVTLGSVFLAVAVFIYIRQSQSIKKSGLVNGLVIRMETNSEGMSAPVIEYQWDEKKWIYASNTWSHPPSYEVGEQVPIYVNREDPADIIVDTFSERWILITIFGGMGVLFAGIPFAVIRSTKQTGRMS